VDRDSLIDAVAELRTGAVYLQVAAEKVEIQWVAPAVGLILAAIGLLLLFFAPDNAGDYATLLFAGLALVCVLRIVASRNELKILRQEVRVMEARHAMQRERLIDQFTSELS